MAERVPRSQRTDSSIVIESSVRKMIWLISIMGAMTALPMLAIPIKPLLGWIGTIFTLPCFILALYLYRPSATYLQLNLEGFEAVSAGQRIKVKWSDVSGFHIGEVNGEKVIGILYAETYRAQLSTSAISHTDSERARIRNLYELSLEATCNVLNQWKAAHDVHSCTT